MSDWSGKKVVIIGVARQGIALARYLVRHGAQVVLNDQRPADELVASRAALADLSENPALLWVFGGHPFDLLDGTDLVCPSGGVPLTLPLIKEAIRRGIQLSNDSQIFLETAPCKVIGITGSAGKTTTTTLVGRMADNWAGRCDQRAWTGGNIGNPLISVVDEMRPADLAVVELSSFQLEIMTRSPQIAAVLNITPNHLDRHGSMQEYTNAKAQIMLHQQPEDSVVLNVQDEGSWQLHKQAAGKVWAFGGQAVWDGSRLVPGAYVQGDHLVLFNGGSTQPIMPRNLVQLRGEHNLLNVLAACTIAAAAGIDFKAMRAAVDGFGGVAHRLQHVRTWRGAQWYNDSIATAPERAMAAIRSFSEPLVLLAGGRDKNLPWESFAELVCKRVAHLVVFGEAADKILTALKPYQERPDSQVQVIHCANLRQAVAAAAQRVQPGAVVLLSPGGTSFDEFRDFEERGECYMQYVNDLP